MLTFKGLGRAGRIGNQMFQIAGAIGFAEKHGYSYGFPYWQNYDQLERFGGGEDIDVQKWFKHWLPTYKEGVAFHDRSIPWGFHEMEVPDNSNLKGHMQSEKYFLHCKELIKHYFTFEKEELPLTNTLAVHFRGGDYGGNYHPTCTREYYDRAFSQFQGIERVLLFTDDPVRASDVISFPYELVTGNHSMVDMNLISKCDHHIIANSTFSWWGAWLADSKKVVAPMTWFGPDARGLATADIYPENWIKI